MYVLSDVFLVPKFDDFEFFNSNSDELARLIKVLEYSPSSPERFMFAIFSFWFNEKLWSAGFHPALNCSNFVF